MVFGIKLACFFSNISSTGSQIIIMLKFLHWILISGDNLFGDTISLLNQKVHKHALYLGI